MEILEQIGSSLGKMSGILTFTFLTLFTLTFFFKETIREWLNFKLKKKKPKEIKALFVLLKIAVFLCFFILFIRSQMAGAGSGRFHALWKSVENLKQNDTFPQVCGEGRSRVVRKRLPTVVKAIPVTGTGLSAP